MNPKPKADGDGEISICYLPILVHQPTEYLRVNLSHELAGGWSNTCLAKSKNIILYFYIKEQHGSKHPTPSLSQLAGVIRCFNQPKKIKQQLH